ncbi:MAG: hypothetical protein KAT49_03615 [Methanomicrobia archaeon]|nr:hypothetical protein [Methanomicrobia archaeon]
MKSQAKEHQKGEIALKYEKYFKEQAKEKQLSGLKQYSTVLQNSAEREPIDPREELAKIAGVSQLTMPLFALLVLSIIVPIARWESSNTSAIFLDGFAFFVRMVNFTEICIFPYVTYLSWCKLPQFVNYHQLLTH